MNRLSPLIVRRAAPSRGTAAASASLPAALAFAEVKPGEWLEDLKLFATGWIGGLVFFGTLLG